MSIVGTAALTKFWELCKGTFVKKGDSISRSMALVNATSRKDFNLLIDDDVTRVRNMAYTHFAMDNPTAPTGENKNYNVITLSGSDGFAISQLALGTSDQEVYYRKAAWNRDSRNWTPWKRLIFAGECPMLTEVPLKFAQDAEGNWGYVAPGADTVIPFKKSIEDGEFKSPFCPLTDSYSYVSSSAYDISKLKMANNDAGYKKMKVEGSLTGRLTSGTLSRDISLWFFAYLANPDGSRGNSRNTQIAKVTATSVTAQSVNFSKEIDLSDLWYAGNATSAYTPVIRLDVRGTYGSGSVQINNMTFYK
ncbi:MAG: hypothetical protein K2P13_01470 [Lachnospiraceae bacterium]|nr:hypothetical protein [Lachnospiraceae bacterium]